MLVLRAERRVRHRAGCLPLGVHHFKTKFVDLAAGTDTHNLPNCLQVAVEYQSCREQLRMRRCGTNPGQHIPVISGMNLVHGVSQCCELLGGEILIPKPFYPVRALSECTAIAMLAAPFFCNPTVPHVV